MRARVTCVYDVNLVRTIAPLKHLLEQVGVVVFESPGPTERVSDDQNPESARRFRQRVIAIIKAKPICDRAVITLAHDSRSRGKVSARAKSQIRVVFKSTFEEIRIEHDHQDLNADP